MASSENLELQKIEDQWWDTSDQYRTYHQLPTSSKWHYRVKPGTSNVTLAVNGKSLTFPRSWLSIFFLLDLQQLSSMALAMSSDSPTFSNRLYSNVAFIHHLRSHIIQARLEVQDMENNWMPLHLERWMRRLLHDLSNEKGAYMALKEDFNKVYQSGIDVWKLGNHAQL
jgi:hypothetical protein